MPTNFDMGPDVGGSEYVPKNKKEKPVQSPPSSNSNKVDESSSNYSNSSGLGSVIYHKVQKNLFNRLDIKNKDKIDGNSTRTVWARMVSGVTPAENASGLGATGITRPVALMGGVSGPDGKLVGGFDTIYGRTNLDFGQNITDPNSANEFGERYRPMAGITGITTTTEGVRSS